MPLTPGQERELAAVAAELSASDPVLARDLSRPRPMRRPLLHALLVVLVVLLVGIAVGLVPLGIGLDLGLPWLVAVGAVATCGLPIVALRATPRLFPRLSARLRELG